MRVTAPISLSQMAGIVTDIFLFYHQANPMQRGSVSVESYTDLDFDIAKLEALARWQTALQTPKPGYELVPVYDTLVERFRKDAYLIERIRTNSERIFRKVVLSADSTNRDARSFCVRPVITAHVVDATTLRNLLRGQPVQPALRDYSIMLTHPPEVHFYNGSGTSERLERHVYPHFADHVHAMLREAEGNLQSEVVQTAHKITKQLTS